MCNESFGDWDLLRDCCRDSYRIAATSTRLNSELLHDHVQFRGSFVEGAMAKLIQDSGVKAFPKMPERVVTPILTMINRKKALTVLGLIPILVAISLLVKPSRRY